MPCNKHFTTEANFNPPKTFSDYPPYLCDPDNLTGFDDIASQVMDRMLLQQYVGSPNLQEYMKAFITELDILMEEVHKIELGRYIQNATHAQLDVIGVILQQTRNLNIPTVWFGFQGASPVDGMADEVYPLAGGLFKSEDDDETTAAEPLNDKVYRKVLLCRGYVLNQTVFDVNTVYKAIETALGKVPVDIRLYEDSERNWILELDADSTTAEEIGIIRAIQHWFTPMITNLNVRVKLIKRLLDSGSIVDVQRYDTRNDSLANTWITDNTKSWNLETLFTTTRGKTADFPVIVLIVTQNNKITIYDATKLDFPMWMVFNTGYASGLVRARMMNGKLFTASDVNVVDQVWDFAADTLFTRYNFSTANGLSVSNVSERNSYSNGTGDTNIYLDWNTNSLALSDDGAGGVDTYYSTDSGLSRVADDGTVSNWTDDGNTVFQTEDCKIVGADIQWAVSNNDGGYYILLQPRNTALVESRFSSTDLKYTQASSLAWSLDMLNITHGTASYKTLDITENAIGSSGLLQRLWPDTTNYGLGMYSLIHTDFNSGILIGDVRGVFLANSKVTDLSRSLGNLTEVGSIIEAPIEVGAELKSYSGFSTINYLQQAAYNANLDVGTGSLYIKGWFRTSNSALGTVCSFGTNAGNGFNLDISSTSIRFILNDGTNRVLSLLGDYTDGELHFLEVFRDSSDNASIYVDRVDSATAASWNYNIINGTGIFRIGINRALGAAWGGDLALIEVSATVPTPAQSDSIYALESAIVKQNSKCLLHNLSSSVQALDYDSARDNLVVCTTDATSIFKGLERVSEGDDIATSVDTYNEAILTGSPSGAYYET